MHQWEIPHPHDPFLRTLSSSKENSGLQTTGERLWDCPDRNNLSQRCIVSPTSNGRCVSKQFLFYLLLRQRRWSPWNTVPFFLMLSALRFSVNNTLASTRQFNPCCAKVHSTADVCTTSAVQRSQQERIRPTLGASKGCPLRHVTIQKGVPLLTAARQVFVFIQVTLWGVHKMETYLSSL